MSLYFRKLCVFTTVLPPSLVFCAHRNCAVPELPAVMMIPLIHATCVPVPLLTDPNVSVEASVRMTVWVPATLLACHALVTPSDPEVSPQNIVAPDGNV